MIKYKPSEKLPIDGTKVIIAINKKNPSLNGWCEAFFDLTSHWSGLKSPGFLTSHREVHFSIDEVDWWCDPLEKQNIIDGWICSHPKFGENYPILRCYGHTEASAMHNLSLNIGRRYLTHEKYKLIDNPHFLRLAGELALQDGWQIRPFTLTLWDLKEVANGKI